jgi:hypothetical protein
VSLTVLAGVCLALAALPLFVYRRNAALYRPPPGPDVGERVPAVSVLIPARNEEASIGPAVEAALASRGVEVEVVVLDDHSTDRTAEVVTALAARDERVRLESAPPLPEGWCGKQHACAALARLARYDVMAFVDADVRLAPDGLARLAAFLRKSGAALVSGIPRQETVTPLEQLVIPLIHFLLLGFLPMGRMRRSTHPGFGAGCGQLFLTRRDAYGRAGTHAAVKTSLHDGITLPRAYRRAGLMTDLCDATELATCRMYRSAGELWHGLAKNAREGLAAPRLIVFSTLLLAFGQVLPPVLLAAALAMGQPLAALLAGWATVAAYAPRFDAVRRFRQPLAGAMLHPLGVAVLLAIQWYATARALVGRPVGWKGRAHPGAGRSPAARG